MANAECLLRLLICIAFCHIANGANLPNGNNSDKTAALQFLLANDVDQKLHCRMNAEASWEFYTNITEENRNRMLQTETKVGKFISETYTNASSFDWKSFENDDPLMYKWFKSLLELGTISLPADKQNKLQELIANMTDIYSKAKVCNQSITCTNPTLELEPDLAKIFITSDNYEDLERVWVAWRDATGKKLREPFIEYVELKNEAAQLNGFTDTGEEWRNPYGDGFREAVASLWEDIKPFYLQLHAYVRKKLVEKYPGKVKPDGPIPAHILGNMWAATWVPLFKLVQPYKNETAINADQALLDKKITPLQMFEMSDSFYTSLGLHAMTPEFWNRSMMVKPSGRDVLCHPLAMNFCDGKDARIKMCTETSMEYLVIIHHEMGHVQYFLQYANQPYVFQGGANPGFHEAIGDALALSVSTPGHLLQIGLLDNAADSYAADINYLMQIALDKITFLPFGYLLDIWRWDLFSGKITQDQLNTEWWRMSLEYQGICPSVKRTESDLDAATLLHVIADVSYMRYFVAFVIQFQFHKALCKEAGQTGPLHKCDIYNSKEAGKLLSDVLSKGSSVTWNEAMSILTKGETDQMDAAGLLEYFAPLIDWLKIQNENEVVGWTSDDPTFCP